MRCLRMLVLLWFVLAADAARAQDRPADLGAMQNRLEKLEELCEQLREQNARLQRSFAAPQAISLGLPAEAVQQVILAEKKIDLKKLDDRSKEEVFEVGKSLDFKTFWKNGFWAETADKAFRFNVGGVIQYDLSFYAANSEVLRSVGVFNNYVDPGLALSDGMNPRRARLRFAGFIWEQVEFFAQYEFAQTLDLRRRTLGINNTNAVNSDLEPVEGILLNEVYIGMVKLPVIGQLRIGRHRESLNFVTATSDGNQVWLERGLMFDAFNGDFNFANGITVQNTWHDDRVYGYFGFFQNNSRNFAAVGDGEYAYDGRLTCLPVYSEETETWVHLGVDYSYRNLHFEQTRMRARPMIRAGNGFQVPNIVNTGTLFSHDAQQIVNLEFAAARGPWTIAAEAATSWVTNAYTGSLPLANGTLPAGAKSVGMYHAKGGYFEVMYFLTPDHRKYRKDRPGYDRVVPRESFFCITDGHVCLHNCGGWEVGIRYDWLDLIDDDVNGGESEAVTLALNWYLNPNARVQFNYFVMDRQFSLNNDPGRVDGIIQGFGTRFNMDF